MCAAALAGVFTIPTKAEVDVDDAMDSGDMPTKHDLYVSIFQCILNHHAPLSGPGVGHPQKYKASVLYDTDRNSE